MSRANHQIQDLESQCGHVVCQIYKIGSQPLLDAREPKGRFEDVL